MYHVGNHNFDGDLRSPSIVRQEIWDNVSTYREMVVDPVNGDDSPSNDGYIRPLKTLFALFQRLSARSFSRGDYWFNNPSVRLKAGVHTFAGVPEAENNWYEILSTGNATIYGEISAPLATFQLDSVAGDTTRWSKPAGDDPWVVDAYAGKWIRLPQTYLPAGLPPEWGYSYVPILGNTTHELTLGTVFAPIGWGDVPVTGTTIEIVEMATTINASTLYGAYFYGSGAVGGGLTWEYLKFESTPDAYWMLYGQSVLMSFYSCHFLGHSNNVLSFTDSTVYIRGPSLLQNAFVGISITGRSTAYLWENAFLNCGRCIDASGPAFLDIWAHYHTRNCDRLFFSGGGATTFVDGMFALAARGLWQLYDASVGGQIWLGAPTILDGALASVWVYIYGPGIITVNGNRAEAGLGSLVHGYDMGWTGLSIADLKTVHEGYWFGSAGVTFQLSTPWWT